MDEVSTSKGLTTPVASWHRRVILFLWLIVATLPRPGHAGEAPTLLILQSHAGRPYGRLSELVQDRVAGMGLVIEVRTGEGITPPPPPTHRPSLILAIGTQAARRALENWPDTPTLTTLIPRRVFAELAAERRQAIAQGRLSAIYLDQPIERQFRFLRALLPQSRAIGTLYGSSSIEQARELERLTLTAGLDFHGLDGRQSNLSRTIRRLARLSDVILALPDRSVMTPNHAKWLLYIAYQHRTPVVAFSRHYVEAGALAALYTAPDQIARQVGGAIRHFLEAPGRRRLEPARFPDDFSIAINRHVAHSLGIELPDIALVRRRMEAHRQAPSNRSGSRP